MQSVRYGQNQSTNTVGLNMSYYTLTDLRGLSRCSNFVHIKSLR